MLNIYDLISKLFSIYLFSVLFYTRIPIKLTVIVGFVLILDLIYIYVKRLYKSRAILLMWLLFVLLFTSLVTNNFLVNFSDYTRIATYFLLIGLIIDKKELNQLSAAFNRNRGLLSISAILASIITLVCLFIPSCYAAESTWGEDNRYYLGLSETFHVNASCMCLCLVMYIYSICNKKFKITELVVVFPPLLAIIQSGARVYLICAVCIIVIYYIERINDLQIKYLFVPIGLIGGGYYLLNSNMMKKFLFTQVNYTASNTTRLNSLTSGRLGFWKTGIEGFVDGNIINQLFGHGFNFIRDLTGHSGHNDLIHMLLGMGVIGLIVYLVYMLKAIGVMHKNIKIANDTKLIRFMYFFSITLYVFGPMVMNGLFGYQHLLYSIVIMAILLEDKVKQRSEINGLS